MIRRNINPHCRWIISICGCTKSHCSRCCPISSGVNPHRRWITSAGCCCLPHCRGNNSAGKGPKSSCNWGCSGCICVITQWSRTRAACDCYISHCNWICTACCCALTHRGWNNSTGKGSKSHCSGIGSTGKWSFSHWNRAVPAGRSAIPKWCWSKSACGINQSKCSWICPIGNIVISWSEWVISNVGIIPLHSIDTSGPECCSSRVPHHSCTSPCCWYSSNTGCTGWNKPICSGNSYCSGISRYSPSIIICPVKT